MEEKDQTGKEARRAERQKVYNTKRWKELRLYMVMKYPLCQDCLKAGRITPTEEIHHIKSPFRKGLTPDEKDRLAYDETNLVALCRECHRKRHHHDDPIQVKLKKYAD